MELSDKIKLLRKEKHLTQRQIAEALKIDSSTVSYWEKGREEPNAPMRKKLCQFLGVTQSELFKDV